MQVTHRQLYIVAYVSGGITIISGPSFSTGDTNQQTARSGKGGGIGANITSIGLAGDRINIHRRPFNKVCSVGNGRIRSGIRLSIGK